MKIGHEERTYLGITSAVGMGRIEIDDPGRALDSPRLDWVRPALECWGRNRSDDLKVMVEVSGVGFPDDAGPGEFRLEVEVSGWEGRTSIKLSSEAGPLMLADRLEIAIFGLWLRLRRLRKESRPAPGP